MSVLRTLDLYVNAFYQLSLHVFKRFGVPAYVIRFSVVVVTCRALAQCAGVELRTATTVNGLLISAVASALVLTLFGLPAFVQMLEAVFGRVLPDVRTMLAGLAPFRTKVLWIRPAVFIATLILVVPALMRPEVWWYWMIAAVFVTSTLYIETCR